METLMEQIARHKFRAELFLKNNTPSFIIDTSGNWHSCTMLKIFEDNILVKEFDGKLQGQENIINFVDITRFEVHKGNGGSNGYSG